MDIQSLEKLNELKEKGILTEEEFNQQKKVILEQSSEKSSNSILKTLLKCVAAVFAVLLIVAGINMENYGLPACDDPDFMKTDLLDTINTMPLLKFTDIQAVTADNAQEILYDEKKGVRQCSADVKLSSTAEIKVLYTLTEKDDEILIEAEIAE